MTENTIVSLNLQSPNISTIVYAVQNDKLSRHIVAQLRDGSAPWTPPAGALPTVRYLKPDGTAGFYDSDEDDNPAIVISGSTATITIVEQALTVHGDVYMQLNFYGTDGSKLTTFCWLLRVQKSVLEDATIVSSDYYNTLTATMAQVAEDRAAVEAIAASITLPWPIASGGTAATTAGEALSNLGGIRPNLLDNAYFVGGGSQSGWGIFPINQRGQTSYSTSNAYGIDRWKANTATGFSLSSGYASFESISQVLPSASDLVGKTLTASVLLSSGALYSGTAVLTSLSANTVFYQSNNVTIRYSSYWNGIQIFCNTSGSTISVVAVKLEIGTSQTLAHQENGTWVLNEVPDFAEQLAKCQAYFVRLAGGAVRYAPTQITASVIDFTIPLPVTMRGTPTDSATLTASANMGVYINGAAQTGFTFSAVDVDANAFCIRATKNAHGATGADVVLLNIGTGSTSPTFLSLEP